MKVISSNSPSIALQNHRFWLMSHLRQTSVAKAFWFDPLRNRRNSEALTLNSFSSEQGFTDHGPKSAYNLLVFYPICKIQKAKEILIFNLDHAYKNSEKTNPDLWSVMIDHVTYFIRVKAIYYANLKLFLHISKISVRLCLITIKISTK